MTSGILAILLIVAAPAPTAQPLPAGEMVSVPAGKFFMGCNDKVDKECFDAERPGREIDVAAFSIDRTEVTVAQYRRCVQAGACTSTGLGVPFWEKAEQPKWAQFCNWDKPGRDQHPINCLDWSQAKAVCAWAGKRLPTEAEWEKAARGTDGRKFPWGNSGYKRTTKVANIADAAAKRDYPKWTTAKFYDDGFVGTAPVGSFAAGASPYGALDMLGNVWEWLADEYKTGRAGRGGAWDSPPYVRISTRTYFEPDERYERVGVRCAK
jgi:formylglycine-generating enzyme required for sulfatase activity